MTISLAEIPYFFHCYFDSDANIKVTRYDNCSILNYIKSALKKNDVIGLCRSLIINNNKEVICYSPPKSITYDYFMESEMSRLDAVIGMEFIEGTMINVFWDGVKWEISTKSVLGGTNGFYNFPNAKTFKMMFDEACQVTSLDIESLDKTKCYSFVLKHPENRIVIPIASPQLYLISVFSIKNIFNDSGVPINALVDLVNPLEIPGWPCWENTRVMFPKIFDLKETEISTLIETYASPHGSSPYDSMGIVFYNVETGNRTKLRNIAYEKVRQLRGNQSKLEYQYLCLRQENKVSDFLKWYPETKHYITDCRNKLHLFTKDLFSNYISCFIKKEKRLSMYSGRYKHHMYNIHRLYLTELKSEQKYVTFQVVKEYVNTLAPALLLHSLNYDMPRV